MNPAPRIGSSPYVAAVDLPPVASPTHLTLPSGRQILIDILVQKFLAEFIRITEREISQDEACLELERSWKTSVDADRALELKKSREESENLRNTGKVREYGLGGTLALSGIASVIGGNLLLGGAGIVAGVMQMLDQYFERRGSDAICSSLAAFLPVSEESLQDATALFSTFASIAATLMLGIYTNPADKFKAVQQALSVATGVTKAAFGYMEGQITERRDEHKARSIEIDAESDLVREAIQKTMEQIGRYAEQVQQFQRMQIQLAEKDKSLKSNIFSMAR